METVNAFRMSRMILTAFELGIFDQLSGRSISSSALAGAMFMLNMVAGTKHGDTYTERELRGWMQDAGLEEIRLLTAPSGMQVMIGIKMQDF